MRTNEVHYTVVLDETIGDEKREATIEIWPEGSLYRVSASPTRSPERRGLTSWVDDGGVKLFLTVEEAKRAVESGRGPLFWGRKVVPSMN